MANFNGHQNADYLSCWQILSLRPRSVFIFLTVRFTNSACSVMFSRDQFNSAVSKTLAKFRISSPLYREQKIALFSFLTERDVIVNLPTSYGKSIIFEIAPAVMSLLRQDLENPLVIVISPYVIIYHVSNFKTN